MIDYVSRSDYVQNSVGSVEFDDSTDGSWVRYTTYFRVATGYYGLPRTYTGFIGPMIFAFANRFFRLVV